MKRLGGGVHQRSQCPISYEMQHWYLLTLWIGRVTASSSHIASCGKSVAHDGVCICVKPVLCGKSLRNNLSWRASLCVCMCFYFCGGFAFCCMPPDERWPDRPSHVTYLETGKAVLNPHCYNPRRSSESKRKLTHTYIHMKGGSCQSRTITGRQEPLRWKITLANQLLIESLSSAGGQWNAHDVLFPWNRSQSVASDAFAVMLILIKCNYSLFFQSCVFIGLSSDGWWW